MAYTYQRRAELAHRRLEALGIHTTRNPEKFLRTLSAEQRRESAVRLRDLEPGYRPGRAVPPAREPRAPRRPSRARTPSRQIVNTAAGTITTSSQLRVIKQAVRDAAQRNQLIAFRATFTDGAGRIRTRYLDGSHGGVGATGAEPGQRPKGKVVAISIPSWVGGDGFDPQDIIDSWDEYDGWDWLVDLWDEDYFG